MDTGPDQPGRRPPDVVSGGPSAAPGEPRWEDPPAISPVLGLSVPALPRRVRQVLGNAHSHYVVLDFGDPSDPAGPFLSVTSRPADRRRRLPRGALLEAALLSFSARLSDSGGFSADPGAFDPAPPALSPVEHALILVEERRVACVTRRQGNAFAAHAYLSAEVLPPGPGSSGTLVTVAGRGIGLSDLRLAAAPDLGSQAAALEQIGQRGSVSEIAAGTGPIRFDAIEQLLQTGLRIPGSARHAEVRPWMMDLRTRWAEAHRTQMHFAGQDPEAAAQALLALLDQMKALSAAVPWWQEAGAEALAESVRHAVFASDVRSRPAQDLWRHGVTGSTTEARWLHAWQRWYSQRTLT